MKSKKTLITILPLLILFSCVNQEAPKTSSTPAKKEIDMVILAGQSNAAGYSAILENKTETFQNTVYAGETDRVLIGNEFKKGTDFLSSSDKYVQGIRGGLGYTSSHIGPEYGIAKKLSSNYNENKKLMVLKTAAGGTTLADVSSNLSGVYGNWYPRSLWEDGYTPNIEASSPKNDATGLLYHLLVENFRLVYEDLIDDGYKVNILGVCWSQGESDADLGGEAVYNYPRLLETFITDLRFDIADITGESLYEDELPFVIGKIAPTYYGYNRSINFQMATKQDEVASSMDYVYAFSTDDLIVIQQNGKRNEGCLDDWHFNFADMTTFGERFAQALIEAN